MVLKTVVSFLLFGYLLAAPAAAQISLWRAEEGKVKFSSDAPLELITAESKDMRGIISPLDRTFAFSVRVSSFQGFNSDIQRTHFLENYMEEKKFSQATFQGKLIEDISLDTPGEYTIRVKGILTIHGVSKERIIKGTLNVTGKSIRLETRFGVPLSDHGITIPKIVMQKIAEEIDVQVDILFTMSSVQ